jgi:hypothetical protein
MHDLRQVLTNFSSNSVDSIYADMRQILSIRIRLCSRANRWGRKPRSQKWGKVTFGGCA